MVVTVGPWEGASKALPRGEEVVEEEDLDREVATTGRKAWSAVGKAI